jgi:hypothetical protein
MCMEAGGDYTEYLPPDAGYTATKAGSNRNEICNLQTTS